ncbi:MAG: outer membrane beta-barrel protein, partial [Candidatus Cryptobacteroides sp.]
KSRTTNPSVSMMQGSVNLTNLSNVRSGNPDIVPSYLHNFDIRYIHTNRRKGSTISVSMSVAGSGSYLCDSLVVDSPDFEVVEGVKLGDGNQFSKPINLGGYYKVSGRLTYGFPVKFLSSNFNLDLSGFVSSVPGMINADYVPVHRDGCSIGGKLDSNISDRLDFTVSYNAQYVNNEYSSAIGVTRNSYFTQNARGSVKWIFWKGFVLTGSLHFQQNLSIDRLYNDRLLYCDVFLGKKLFRNQLGEINIGVNDLFNATGHYFRHTINSNGATDTSDLGLGRYFSIQFVYHLRHY